MDYKKLDIEYFSALVEKSMITNNNKNAFKTIDKYGTRLNHGIKFYLKQISTSSDELKVLDLGCGTGGNKKYLSFLGINDVVMFDIDSNMADVLGDGHFLPFKSSTFDLVLSTAVTEHLYNPFIAYKEIKRILKPDGILLGSVSFWEKWHDNSYFHCTPNGIHMLCYSNNLTLIDIWSGWGGINSVVSHAFSKRLKIPGFYLQLIFEKILGFLKGDKAVIRHRLMTSGSFGFYAKVVNDSIKSQK